MNSAQAKKSEPSKTAFTELEIKKIRTDFPTLQELVHGKTLIYLDNAATTLKPIAVIKAIDDYYRHKTSNVHRGIHFLSEQATTLYENARTKIQKFINAPSREQIIFTRGTTSAINLVAQSYGRNFLKSGDEILITHMEHHSNIVPWQMLCEHTGAVLKVAPINERGELILEEFYKLLTHKTRLVSLCWISNTLGSINPVQEIIKAAHAQNAVIVIDAAQAMAHRNVDVQELDCDFLAFSGHKMFGPTGIGVLYGKLELLEKMPPVEGGGDMIDTVTFEKTTYNVIPQKFEAGTPPIAGVIGLGAAVGYILSLGLEKIKLHEHELLEHATQGLSEIPGLKIIGTAKEKSAIISFVMEGAHPHDIGTLIDQEGVALRTGHHCTQPLMARFGISATARASFSVYNTRGEINEFISALKKIKKLF